MIEVQELADLIRQSPSQLIGLAALRNHLADAHDGLKSGAIVLGRNDRVHIHSLMFGAGSRLLVHPRSTDK